MIPKSGKSPADSRKSVGIHEFAALARSSLNGEKTLFDLLSNNGVTNMVSDLYISVSSRHLSGSEGPCDKTHFPGSGPGGPPHRVERVA